jgi:protein-S-isoprenylcysteine O-methyltransferase Ste14
MTERIIAYIVLAVFFVMDSFVRRGKKAKSIEKTNTDNRSTVFIVISFFTVLVISLVLNWLQIGVFNNELIGIIGLVIMVLGLIIRITSMLTLSKYYTRTLVMVDEQTIVKNGIYKYIRHPGYLGTILIWCSAGVAMENSIVTIITSILILVAYYYRISNEEKMLVNTFGEKYKEYKQHTWRLLPFIW